MEAQLRDVHTRLMKAWPPFADQPEAVRWGLVEAGFQLGVPGLLRFGDTLAAIASGDVQGAVAGLQGIAVVPADT